MISDIKIKGPVWICFLCLLASQLSCRGQEDHDPWEKARSIASEIAHTSFPDQVYLITDFGALADDGNTDWEAIKQAINQCAASGGGKVLVPPGIFRTGPLTLHSDVNLHLDSGAVLEFSTRPEDYLPVVRSRWEGVDCYNYSPLIYAFKSRNIAITGKGILDGRACDTIWWSWKGRQEYGWKEGMLNQDNPAGRPRLLSMMENGTDVENRIMGENAYLRPPFVQFFQCSTVLVEDVTIKNSPFWLIHPVLTDNIIIRGVRAESHGPNNDGCDPESSRNVLIENCFFDTGDDCIAIKSGRNEDGRKWGVPTENVLIRNCNMKNGHGGVVIGSEISGGCRNVFVEDCLMDSPELERAIRIKTNSFRGGIVENLFVRNVEIGQVREAVLKINCQYDMKDREQGEFMPLVRNIRLEDISSRESKYAIFLLGIEGEDVIQGILIRNARFDGVREGNFIRFAGDPEMHRVYINDVLVGE